MKVANVFPLSFQSLRGSGEIGENIFVSNLSGQSKNIVFFCFDMERLAMVRYPAPGLKIMSENNSNFFCISSY